MATTCDPSAPFGVLSRTQATGKGGHRLLLPADPSNLTVAFGLSFHFAATVDEMATGQPGYAISLFGGAKG